MNVWILLGLSIGAEITGTSLLKMSDGFRQPLWGALSLLCYLFCFVAMSFVLRSIPMGVTYALWSGVGIAAITVIGCAAFKQTLNLTQVVCIVVIAVGCVVLSLATKPTS